MIRSNCKAALTAIRAYIDDALYDYCYDVNYEHPEDTPTEFDGRCRLYYDEALDKHGWMLKRGHTIQEVIEYDITAGSGAFDYYYPQQRACIQSWLQQTDEEADKYSPDEVERMYLRLISREIIKAAQKARR